MPFLYVSADVSETSLHVSSDVSETSLHVSSHISETAFLGESACGLRAGVLQDHYDVKMPCHLLLAKLAGRAGGKLIAQLDTLVPPLEKTLLVKLKADAVKQEVRPPINTESEYYFVMSMRAWSYRICQRLQLLVLKCVDISSSPAVIV